MPSRTLPPRTVFRALAFAEAVTWTLLLLGLLLKYGTRTTDVGVSIAGPIHGFVFIAYGATVVLVGLNQRWRLPVIALGIVSAVVPYATIPFHLGVHRRGLLDGAWRTETTDHPGDRRPIDRAMRWMLARPTLLVTGLVVVVVVVFVVLLIGGPPGGE